MIDTSRPDLSLKEKIHDSLFQDILNGIYQTETLLHEKKLMEHFQVSRSPVREALIQLCSEQMLRSIPQKGYLVTAMSAEDMKHLTVFRQVLECTFLQCFSSCITQEAIQKLEKHLASSDLSHQQKTALEHWKLNSEFHLILFSNYHNPFAYSKLQEALIGQTRFYAQGRSLRWDFSAFIDPSSLHFAILDYLKKGNVKMAVNLLKADIEDILAV